MTPDRRVLALLVLVNVLWTPVNLAIKTATGGGFTPLGLAATRWMILSIVLGLFLALPPFRRMSDAKFPARIDAGKAVLLGLLFFGPTHALYYTALERTSSFEGNALGTTAPIWVAVLSFIFLRERPTPLRLLAIGLGFVGAYIVSIGFGPPRMEAGHTSGNLLYTLGVFLESIVGVGAAVLIRRSSGITIL
ncbi:EamA family transporter, partial [bacterium]